MGGGRVLPQKYFQKFTSYVTKNHPQVKICNYIEIKFINFKFRSRELNLCIV